MSFFAHLRLLRKKNKSLKRGEIELHILKFLCNRDKVSIDVGANKGNYSLEMSKYSKRVLCIEPNSNFNKYLKNLPKNCEILNCAVSSSEQETFLHAPIIDGDAKPNTAFISQNETVENTTCISRVNTIRLDNYIDENVGMIKIDVEGGELDVLNSSQKLIQRCWPNFLIEGLTKNELMEQINFFKSFGYIGLKIIKDDIFFVKDENIFDKCRKVDRNTIFIPTKKPYY